MTPARLWGILTDHTMTGEHPICFLWLHSYSHQLEVHPAYEDVCPARELFIRWFEIDLLHLLASQLPLRVCWGGEKGNATVAVS